LAADVQQAARGDGVQHPRCDNAANLAQGFQILNAAALEAYKIAKATEKDGQRVRHKEE
jgi:hypothetical protein